MRRRDLLALAGVATAFPARAQKVPRVGFLIAGDPEPGWTLFRKAMTERGYVEGRTVAYEYRAGSTSREALEGLVDSLIASKVEVIVAVLTPAMTAASAKTKSIPIVFDSAAPEAANVNNVARPGGNVTGVFTPSSNIAGKCLQLLHEARPAAKTFGVMLNMRDPFHVPMQRDVEAAARAEHVDCRLYPVASPEELPQVFATVAQQGLDGVVLQPSLGLERGAKLALEHRLPVISLRRSFVEFGGLLSYGADQADICRIMASQVDLILKGANPADLPVQQSSRFELVANRRTAKALDFVFPPLFLARIDEMVE